MENIPFLVARRRNQQRRNGASWVAHLEEITSIQPGSAHLVPAEESIPREHRMRELSRQGLVNGTVVRLSGVSLNDVAGIWESALSVCSTEIVVCAMHHHPDFVFAIPAFHLLGKLKALLDFDGDTIAVTSRDLAKGIAVDMYTENQATLYEVDRWGEWQSSCR